MVTSSFLLKFRLVLKHFVPKVRELFESTLDDNSRSLYTSLAHKQLLDSSTCFHNCQTLFLQIKESL